jgi:methionyl-tRNA formyltransferase
MSVPSSNSTGAVRPPLLARRLRVALLCSDDAHHRWLEARLAREFDLACVVIEPSRAQQASLWRRRRWVAWAARGYQVQRQCLTKRTAYRRRYFAIPEYAAQSLRVEVDSINAEQTRTTLAVVCPDVIVVCGTTLLRLDVLGGTTAINLHGGWLPDYKGNHGVYFAYERGDFEHIGASLHIVSADLDGGDLIDVIRPPILPYDNDEHLYCRSVVAATIRLCERLARMESGEPLDRTPQPAGGETFRHRDRTPGRELRLWLRRRLGRHRVPRLPPTEWRVAGAPHPDPPALEYWTVEAAAARSKRDESRLES